MQRRLEDVSHFFFDRSDPVPSHQPSAPESQRIGRRPRVIHMAGLGDHVTAGMIVAGLAATANRMGWRVLAAQTHDQPFGVAFGLGAQSDGGQSVVVQADRDLWVSPTSLLGAKRPGVFFEQLATANWLARVTHVDLVLVHVNHHGGMPLTPAMPIPHELIVVAGKGGREALIPVYRAIKRAVSWNPGVELGVVVTGVHDERLGSTWDKLVQGVATFLGRSCPVVGSVTNVSALSDAFLSGMLLRGGLNEAAPDLTRIVERWTGSVAEAGRRVIPDGHSERGDAGGGSLLAGESSRCQ
jgi:hypothetical protein